MAENQKRRGQVTIPTDLDVIEETKELLEIGRAHV